MTKYTLTHPDGTREELDEDDLIDVVNQRYRADMDADELLILEYGGMIVNVEDGRNTWSISR
jgi:hypothetical protein